MNILAQQKDIDRFWGKVNKTDDPNECWLWMAKWGGNGYGQLRWKNNNWHYAHRVAYELTFGDIPLGLIVCHKCDNPLCCNPNHLFLGTQQDNMNDKVQKNRQLHGESIANHKLTQQQVDEIRRRYSEKKESQYELAKFFGIAQAHVSDIVNHKRWS